MARNELLKALGIGGATLGGAGLLHGAGLSSILEPLDWPRKALWNTIKAPVRAFETGNPSELLGAIPGVAGESIAEWHPEGTIPEDFYSVRTTLTKKKGRR